ncbi:MAG: ABC transporter permease [Prevotellaceae bacterium]|jgi:ABC-type transport system involved in multi-copper enzyme maturation permease subunit|nr:ABC transporter permease [Prevotellaceae bacterium]
MLRLLSIEFLKLRTNRQFLALVLLLLITISVVDYVIMKTNGGNARMMSKLLSIPEEMLAYSLVSFVCGFIFTIPAMIIIMHTCAEYTYKTHRQNIIDGMTRQQYIATKLMLVVAIALFTTIAVYLIAFLIGTFDNSPFSLAAMKYMVFYFVQAVMYLSLAFLFALIIKRSILSLSVFVVYSLIFENILEYKLGKKFDASAISDMLPLASCDHLITAPDRQIFSFIADPKPETVYLAATLIYIAACCALCFYRYGKQDL